MAESAGRRVTPKGTRWVVLMLVVALTGMGCTGSSAKAATTTLRVTMTDDWLTAPFLDAVRDFERTHPNVKVAVESQPIRGMLDLIEARPPDTSPDVVQAHAFSAAARELAQPLDDLWMSQLNSAEFFPGAMQDVTWAGRMYGVPLDTSALVLLYNADHFRAAGVRVPSGVITFEDLRTLARALAAPGGPTRAMALPTSSWRTFGWVAANGGDWVEVGPAGRPRFALDSPQSVGALSFLADLVAEGLAYPPRAAETSSRDVLALFESGTTSMYTSGAWDVIKLRLKDPSTSYGAALMPRGPSGGNAGSALGGSSLFVPKHSRHRTLAFEFMVHLISDRYALRAAKEEGRLPVRPRVFSDDYFRDPILETVFEQLATARPEKIDGFPKAGEALAKAIDQVLREGRDPAAALHEAQLAAVASLGPN